MNDREFWIFMFGVIVGINIVFLAWNIMKLFIGG